MIKVAIKQQISRIHHYLVKNGYEMVFMYVFRIPITEICLELVFNTNNFTKSFCKVNTCRETYRYLGILTMIVTYTAVFTLNSITIREAYCSSDSI